MADRYSNWMELAGAQAQAAMAVIAIVKLQAQLQAAGLEPGDEIRLITRDALMQADAAYGRITALLDEGKEVSDLD